MGDANKLIVSIAIVKRLRSIENVFIFNFQMNLKKFKDIQRFEYYSYWNNCTQLTILIGRQYVFIPFSIRKTFTLYFYTILFYCVVTKRLNKIKSILRVAWSWWPNTFFKYCSLKKMDDGIVASDRNFEHASTTWCFGCV